MCVLREISAASHCYHEQSWPLFGWCGFTSTACNVQRDAMPDREIQEYRKKDSDSLGSIVPLLPTLRWVTAFFLEAKILVLPLSFNM